jgi:hypothetical protein
LSPSLSAPPFCGRTQGVARGVGFIIIGAAVGRGTAVGATVAWGVATGVDVGMTVAAGNGVEAAAADDADADVDGFDPALDATPPQAVSVRNTPAKAS